MAQTPNSPERLEQGLGELYHWLTQATPQPQQYGPMPSSDQMIAAMQEAIAASEGYAPQARNPEDPEQAAQMMLQSLVEQAPPPQAPAGPEVPQGWFPQQTEDQRVQAEAKNFRKQIREALGSGGIITMRGNEISTQEGTKENKAKGFSRDAPGTLNAAWRRMGDPVAELLIQRGFSPQEAALEAIAIRNGRDKQVNEVSESRRQDYNSASSNSLQQMLMDALEKMEPQARALILAQMIK